MDQERKTTPELETLLASSMDVYYLGRATVLGLPIENAEDWLKRGYVVAHVRELNPALLQRPIGYQPASPMKGEAHD